MITEFKSLEEAKNLNLQLRDLNVAVREATRSSNGNSRAMMYLTVALVFLGIVSAAVAWLEYRANNSIVEIRKNCYQSVLQTSNIDLNYKSCLRDNGLSDQIEATF